MVKKIQFKKILGLFILLFLISPIVYAEDSKADSCEAQTNRYLANLYGASIEQVGSSTRYKIKINPINDYAEMRKELRNTTFKVVSINGNAVNDPKLTVKYGSPLTIDGQFVDNPNDDFGQIMKVTIKSDKQDVTSACKGYVGFYLNAYYYSGSQKDSFSGEGAEEMPEVDSPDKVDCDNPKTTFDANFCEAKNGAIANAKDSGENPTVYSFGNKSFDENKFAQFSCAYKGASNIILSDDEEKYYLNRQYLYGTGTKKYDVGNYEYHYAPGETVTGEKITCKVNCEEAVTVEYGPPVATKAGLCFEYKVKVTSRVSCDVAEKPEKPKKDWDVCTPSPSCTGADRFSGYDEESAGPNEEFDACIKSCDGGKYTPKCSDSCYKKVYGNKATRSSMISYVDTAMKLADDEENENEKKKRLLKEAIEKCEKLEDNEKYGGCYYKDLNGAIQWSGGDKGRMGRWYMFYANSRGWHSYWAYLNGWYYVDSGGFMRKCYDDNGDYACSYGDGVCTWACYWKTSDCSEDSYLNYGVGEKDYEENIAKYKEAVNQCSAAASCSTSTATFTISVDYKEKGKTEVKTINFPYSKSEDKLTSLGKTTDIINTADDADSTILSYDGCYKDKETRKTYLTEWSFPGTWIDYKHGEITYKNPNKSSWTSVKDKFCTPFNLEKTNKSWWNYYYANKYYNDNNISINLNAGSVVKDSNGCKTTCDIGKFLNVSYAKVDDWNIKAKTTGFGYFGWNIQIKCFYAYNIDNPGEICTTNCANEKKYTIRTVDLNNMFPDENSNGDVTSTTEKIYLPFNWSEYATNVIKDVNYISRPSIYKNWLESQDMANYYTDDNLDYYVHLTKAEISKLRKNRNYTNWEGNYLELSNRQTTTSYLSPLFRGGSDQLSNFKVPETSVLHCNNLKGQYGSGGCQDFREGE